MAQGLKSKSKSQGKDRSYAPAINDDRFARLQTDPRFLRPNREESKVVIDDRFKGLLSGGESGKRKGKIDKYGRKVNKDTKREDEEEMKRLYRLEKGEDSEASGSGSGSASSSEGEDEGQEEGRFVDYARGEGQLESSEEDTSSEDEDDASESESDSESMGVTIGTSAARRREKLRLRFAGEDGNEDDDEADVDITAAAKELQVEAGDLAELDARAERTVKREAAAARKAAQSMPKRVGDTTRLAVVNMDWDHIRAIDLYKVFSSLVSPAGRPLVASSSSSASNSNGDPGKARGRGGDVAPVKGRVLQVRVYPSNFGLERMAKENQEGPPRDIFKRDEDGKIKAKKRPKGKKHRDDDSDDDESDVELFEVDEGGEFDEEALRNYQLERLRYFYAIVTFDTPEAARHIMNEIDGTEMERTANVFDLSFVPEDMTFPDRQASKEDLTDEGWRDEATEVTDGSMYKGVDFTTDALRHSKVKLTWDADDPQRSKITRQLAQEPLTVDALRDEDFKAYLASDSEPSDDEDGDEDGRDKMRSLLGLNGEGADDEPVRGFGKSKSKAFEDGRKSRQGEGGDGERGQDMQITFMPGLSEAAQRKKKGLAADTKEESTLDKYMRKQREKRERRKKQGNQDPDEGGGEVHDEEADGKLGFDDPFFASDNEVDFEQALADEQRGGGGRRDNGKKSTDRSREEVDPEDVISREELQLMLDSDSEGDGGKAGHFSMKDILKAERDGKGKKSRWAKKKEKKNGSGSKDREDGREHEVQENFAINVQDERFQGVFDDHRFALDPSHPSFHKTKNMAKLVDERRRRDKKKRRESNGAEGAAASSKEAGSDLADLVKSVKKRSTSGMEQQRSNKRVHRT